ncbi:metal-sulfur cluster assembly factor [Persephonella sp.]
MGKLISEVEILKLLKEVYDPEIPLDIVNLGLVRRIIINDARIEIVLTLTTPDCPLENLITKSIQNKLSSKLNGMVEVNIKFDFSKPWNTKMISEEGKEKLRSLGWKV